MDLKNETWQNKWLRRLALTLLVVAASVGLLPLCGGSVQANSGDSTAVVDANHADPTPGFWNEIIESVLKHDFNALMAVLGRPEFTILAFIALNLIVFVETGLLIGFFLPGDSLLVTAGIVCYGSDWNLPLLLATLCVSAIIGDSVGYSIGFKTGPKIFHREKSFFFNKEHLLAAQRFYVAHGGKTIILARFMPIIRTFAPVVAGVGKMDYRRFLFFNIFGGVGWVVSMILIGYFLTPAIDPLFKQLIGPEFEVKKHIEKVIIIVVLLSVAPGGVVWLRRKLKGKQPMPAQPELVGKAEG